MEDYYYKAEEVRESAKNNWLYILDALAPDLSPAIQKKAKGKGHCSCPVHGGKDGFRLFDDAHATGGGICNTCGAFSDGFELLMWLHHIDFTNALVDVGDYMKCTQHKKRKGNKLQRPKMPVKEALQRHAKMVPEKPECTGNKGADLKAKSNNNVVPIDRDVPPWLKEAQDEMEKRQERQKKYSARKAGNIKRIWDDSVCPHSSAAKPMKKYFSLRKLSYKNLSNSSVRFHPDLDYHDEDGNLVGTFPAIICAIKNSEGQIVTLHRTYLTSTGKKARVKCPKKMMPIPEGLRVNGGAIQLGDPVDGVLGVAEGLETAQSVLRASGYPCWCTVNATLLEEFEPPRGIHTILIWADKDRSLTGERKAQLLSEKLKSKGIKVLTLIPPIPFPSNDSKVKGIDWNDVLLGQGLMGFFPTRNQITRAISFMKSDEDAGEIGKTREQSATSGSKDEVIIIPKQAEIIRVEDGNGDVINFDKSTSA